MDAPIVLSREQSRLIDRIAIDEFGIPGVVLMENAGRGVVDVLLEVDPSLESVAVLCGKGNNAGDGFVMARHLAIRGASARVLLLGSPKDLTGDAQINYDILAHSGADVRDLSFFADDPAALTEQLDAHSRGAKWLVDALLGTGAAVLRGNPFARPSPG